MWVGNQARALKFLSREKGMLYAYCLVTEGPFRRKLLELKNDLLKFHFSLAEHTSAGFALFMQLCQNRLPSGSVAPEAITLIG